MPDPAARAVDRGPLALAYEPISAQPARAQVPMELRSNLGALWTTVLETTSAENPFGSGGPASACVQLDGTVAPFGPGGVESCTVRTGTKIFVAASSVECSTFEGNGSTEAELRRCAPSPTCKSRPRSRSTAS